MKKLHIFKLTAFLIFSPLAFGNVEFSITETKCYGGVGQYPIKLIQTTNAKTKNFKLDASFHGGGGSRIIDSKGTAKTVNGQLTVFYSDKKIFGPNGGHMSITFDEKKLQTDGEDYRASIEVLGNHDSDIFDGTHLVTCRNQQITDKNNLPIFLSIDPSYYNYSRTLSPNGSSSIRHHYLISNETHKQIFYNWVSSKGILNLNLDIIQLLKMPPIPGMHTSFKFLNYFITNEELAQVPYIKSPYVTPDFVDLLAYRNSGKYAYTRLISNYFQDFHGTPLAGDLEGPLFQLEVTKMENTCYLLKKSDAQKILEAVQAGKNIYYQCDRCDLYKEKHLIKKEMVQIYETDILRKKHENFWSLVELQYGQLDIEYVFIDGVRASEYTRKKRDNEKHCNETEI